MQKALPASLKYNLWKFFIYNLSHRRNFITILSIYFLTLPNTTAQQIGIYTAAASVTSFLFEIPTGYLADRFGHKHTLILAKLFMILSLFSFIYAHSLTFFVVGSVLMSLGFACYSGTDAAFFHNLLISFRRGKDYTQLMSKLSANISLLSAGLIVLLPFFTKISIVLPFKISLVFDFIGLVAILLIKSPQQKFPRAEQSISIFWQGIRASAGKGFYPAAIFAGAIGGFFIGSTPFRDVYLTSLGYPLVFIGFVMGLSRLIWFVVGHNAHILQEKIGVRNILLFDLFFFPLLLMSVALFSNPYLVGLLFSIGVGYFWGRSSIITHTFLTSFIRKKEYKATILSVKNQIKSFFEIVVAFGIAFVMTKSYKLGYLILGVILFLILLFSYRAAIEKIKMDK